VLLPLNLTPNKIFVGGIKTMKLCWDNLENIILTKNGNFRDIVKKRTYHYGICKYCKEEFFGSEMSVYCSYSCSSKDQWNDPTNAFNLPETKSKISKSVKKLWEDEEYRNNTSSRIKKLWSDPNSSYNGEECRKKMGDSRTGSKNGSWKGGVTKKCLPLYDTYAPKLEWCEEVRRNSNNPNIMEVRCTYCGTWFIPHINNVCNRILSIYGYTDGECRFYCSEECKQACPLYGKTADTLMKEDAVRSGRLKWLDMGREVQHELRQMVLERDNYTCKNCGSTDKPLHCHHILPVAVEPLVSADLDNCITLCVD
jgi:hypothetical protein